jgi:hypothetical protein
MKREQLSDRIGNIEDRLVEQAENAPNFGRGRRSRSIRRMVAIAAVLALMIASFATGAIALARETVVYVESEPVTVYVEKEQEIIKVGDSGISLILPDTWKGKYGYEQDGNYLAVYHLATVETFELGGRFFWIEYIPDRYPMDYAYPDPGFTIAITETGTYRMVYTSDVQANLGDPASSAEYFELIADIHSIEIVMTAETLASTTNASNWVQGTVFVSLLDRESMEVTKTIECDTEQSQTIREIIKSLEFGEQRSFYTDMWIMMGGSDEYYLNSTTGHIMKASGMYSAVLSAEDLSAILDMLN